MRVQNRHKILLYIFLNSWGFYSSYLDSGGTLDFLNQNLPCNSLRGTLSSLCPHIKKVHHFLPKLQISLYSSIKHSMYQILHSKKYIMTTFSTSLSRTKLYVPQQVKHENNSYFIFFGLYY